MLHPPFFITTFLNYKRNTNIFTWFVGFIVCSSGIIWESRKSGNKNFKSMSVFDSNALEEAYKRYQQELIIGKARNRVVIHNNLEVSDDYSLTI